MELYLRKIVKTLFLQYMTESLPTSQFKWNIYYLPGIISTAHFKEGTLKYVKIYPRHR